jgi:hypothetical protein
MQNDPRDLPEDEEVVTPQEEPSTDQPESGEPLGNDLEDAAG